MVDWVAIATLVLAGATGVLAFQVRGQTAAARKADISRQREAQILDIRPLLPGEPSIEGPDGPRRAASLYIEIHDRPVLKLSARLRAMKERPTERSSDGRDWVGGDLGSFAPTDVLVPIRFELADFLSDAEAFIPFEDRWEVEIEYHGILGQRVVERYRWDAVDQIRKLNAQRRWQLTHLTIETSVPGAAILDKEFGTEP